MKPMPKLKDIQLGTQLVANGDFPCLEEGQVVTVQEDEEGDLFVLCYAGEHYLFNQIDDDDGESLVGFTYA